ncbi:2-dehydropantoate 2-reductase [Actinoplanes cyaneus]|uniref:2-dehydropantoate 2-reductase n=1 Tax=Actinoplanes cyaneus TaxID=52696 RepID=A0A919IK33_9ACTN|nr:ketopantoate reductase family protein [Actinoplanes cyaneus]MCW2139465.1 ketopantoate reductase [Actinoplanes cyaneus]GID65996.1 2-dehydropantoate 2-reductase [Actinoplanes cyaneus]
MRVLVAGAGATGGYFGGRLAQAGRDVTFLVRERRAARLASRGLRIRTPVGETRLTPQTIQSPAGAYDVVLVAVKSHALDTVTASLGPAIGGRTVIIPLLNGMRHLGTLTSAFGPEHVWGGLCMIHGTLDEHGDVVQMTGLHRLVFGPLDGGPDDRLDAVTTALTGAGFDSRASRHIVAEMWEKWVLLATLGAATTLMRGAIGAINAAPGGPEFLRALTAEVIAVATAAGHPPRPPARELLDATIASTEPTTSSMYRDLVAGLPVEADAIVGDLVTEAGRHGVPVPLLAAARANLAVYTDSRAT